MGRNVDAIDKYEACEASPADPKIKAKYEEQRAALKNGGPRAFWETKLAQLKKSPSPSLYEWARICARLNQTNEVFALLERAYREHNGDMVDLLVDDCWDPLRGDPRFKDLVRRMGLGHRAVEERALTNPIAHNKLTASGRGIPRQLRAHF